MKYQKHALTEMPDKDKTDWTELIWIDKMGNEKIEKVKYPDGYMKKLFENGIGVVYEKHTKTTRRRAK
mgnify:CR=1 FL=1